RPGGPRLAGRRRQSLCALGHPHDGAAAGAPGRAVLRQHRAPPRARAARVPARHWLAGPRRRQDGRRRVRRAAHPEPRPRLPARRPHPRRNGRRRPLLRRRAHPRDPQCAPRGRALSRGRPRLFRRPAPARVPAGPARPGRQPRHCRADRAGGPVVHVPERVLLVAGLALLPAARHARPQLGQHLPVPRHRRPCLVPGRRLCLGRHLQRRCERHWGRWPCAQVHALRDEHRALRYCRRQQQDGWQPDARCAHTVAGGTRSAHSDARSTYAVTGGYLAAVYAPWYSRASTGDAAQDTRRHAGPQLQSVHRDVAPAHLAARGARPRCHPRHAV
ncbi:hypothetical protein IWQ56_002144, partial [Coemansia nantahalensis]